MDTDLLMISNLLTGIGVIVALGWSFAQSRRMDNQRDSLINQMAGQAMTLKDQIHSSALDRQKEMQVLSLEHQREIRKLSTDNAEMLGYYKAKVERLETAVETGDGERDDYKNLIVELRTELKHKADENEAMRKDFTALERRVRELEDKLTMLNDELDVERKARKEAERERDEARNRAEKLTVQLAEVTKERDELKAQLQADNQPEEAGSDA